MSTPIEWLVNTKKQKVYSVSHTQAVIRGDHTLEEDLLKLENSTDRIEEVTKNLVEDLISTTDSNVTLKGRVIENTASIYSTSKYGTARIIGEDGNLITVSVRLHPLLKHSDDEVKDPNEIPITNELGTLDHIPQLYIVNTYFNGTIVDTQIVESAKDLFNNDYITWNDDAVLEIGDVVFSGGQDPTRPTLSLNTRSENSQVDLQLSDRVYTESVVETLDKKTYSGKIVSPVVHLNRPIDSTNYMLRDLVDGHNFIINDEEGGSITSGPSSHGVFGGTSYGYIHLKTPKNCTVTFRAKAYVSSSQATTYYDAGGIYVGYKPYRPTVIDIHNNVALGDGGSYLLRQSGNNVAISEVTSVLKADTEYYISFFYTKFNDTCAYKDRLIIESLNFQTNIATTEIDDIFNSDSITSYADLLNISNIRVNTVPTTKVSKIERILPEGEHPTLQRANCKYGTSNILGSKGNFIRVEIQEKLNIDYTDIDTNDTLKNVKYYTVDTYYSDTKVDSQNVSTASELLNNNYITWNDDVELTAETVMLEGGTDGVDSNKIGFSKATSKNSIIKNGIVTINSISEEIPSLEALDFTAKVDGFNNKKTALTTKITETTTAKTELDTTWNADCKKITDCFANYKTHNTASNCVEVRDALLRGHSDVLNPVYDLLQRYTLATASLFFVDGNNFIFNDEEKAITSGPSSYHINLGTSYGHIKIRTPESKVTVKIKCYTSTYHNYNCGSIYIGTAEYNPTIIQQYNATTDGKGAYLYIQNGDNKVSAEYTKVLDANTDYYINFAYAKNGAHGHYKDRFIIEHISFQTQFGDIVVFDTDKYDEFKELYEVYKNEEELANSDISADQSFIALNENADVITDLTNTDAIVTALKSASIVSADNTNITNSSYVVSKTVTYEITKVNTMLTNLTTALTTLDKQLTTAINSASTSESSELTLNSDLTAFYDACIAVENELAILTADYEYAKLNSLKSRELVKVAVSNSIKTTLDKATDKLKETFNDGVSVWVDQTFSEMFEPTDEKINALTTRVKELTDISESLINRTCGIYATCSAVCQFNGVNMVEVSDMSTLVDGKNFIFNPSFNGAITSGPSSYNINGGTSYGYLTVTTKDKPVTLTIRACTPTEVADKGGIYIGTDIYKPNVTQATNFTVDLKGCYLMSSGGDADIKTYSIRLDENMTYYVNFFYTKNGGTNQLNDRLMIYRIAFNDGTSEEVLFDNTTYKHSIINSYAKAVATSRDYKPIILTAKQYALQALKNSYKNEITLAEVDDTNFVDGENFEFNDTYKAIVSGRTSYKLSYGTSYGHLKVTTGENPVTIKIKGYVSSTNGYVGGVYIGSEVYYPTATQASNAAVDGKGAYLFRQSNNNTTSTEYTKELEANNVYYVSFFYTKSNNTFSYDDRMIIDGISFVSEDTEEVLFGESNKTAYSEAFSNARIEKSQELYPSTYNKAYSYYSYYRAKEYPKAIFNTPVNNRIEILEVSGFEDGANFVYDETAKAIVSGPNSYKTNAQSAFGYIKIRTPKTINTNCYVRIECKAWTSHWGAVYVGTKLYQPSANDIGNAVIDNNGAWVYRSYNNNTYTQSQSVALKPDTVYYANFMYIKTNSASGGDDVLAINKIEFYDDHGAIVIFGGGGVNASIGVPTEMNTHDTSIEAVTNTQSIDSVDNECIENTLDNTYSTEEYHLYTHKPKSNGVVMGGVLNGIIINGNLITIE